MQPIIPHYACNSSHAPSYCANRRYDRADGMILERPTTLDQVSESGDLAFICNLSFAEIPLVFRKMNARMERKA
ncbi:hypothetical protein RDI58_020872 [Solanum bulbocastanum]|uniref:Uncharacterized protein n=1 Tax=Solanum bulbocastanum TaxID=147425 RepID=A0AAN8TCY5_SOLBU